MSESDRAYFSPGEGPRRAIIRHLEEARNQVDICVFTITDNTISDAIRRAQRRGISIRIITDNYKAEDRGSDIRDLRTSGIDIREDRSRHHMHHKFAVFDRKTLLTGSYNWTRSAAEFNQENVLLTQQGTVVSAFMKEFERLWAALK